MTPEEARTPGGVEVAGLTFSQEPGIDFPSYAVVVPPLTLRMEQVYVDGTRWRAAMQLRASSGEALGTCGTAGTRAECESWLASKIDSLRSALAPRGLKVAEAAPPNAVALIAAERQRQIEGEGRTPEHDDEHMDGVLAAAASCYALQPPEHADDDCGAPEHWPWRAEDWKPGKRNEDGLLPASERVRELVKAGALIVAEIERLQRREALDAALRGGGNAKETP